MNKQRKAHRISKPQLAPARPSRIRRATFVVLAGAVVAMLGYWGWNSRPSLSSAPAIRSAEPSAAKPTAATEPDFQRLLGQWIRPDGGYIIEILSADAEGRLDATYSNPNPIEVAKAQATFDGRTTNVFVELQGANYRGSTYTLAYEPDKNRLHGIYFQALQQQSFEVSFVRMK